MSDVKWIKLSTGIFDNRKIRQIEKMPEGDSIIVIWVKLLCLAGKINDSGMIYFTEKIPYTDDMLATEFDKPLQTVRLALTTFQKFGMIDTVEDVYKVSSWEKYQNVESLEKMREGTRRRVAAYRERKKLECNVTCNADVTLRNDIEEDKEKEKEKEEDKEKKDKVVQKRPAFEVNYQPIADLYNETCVSFPRLTTLSEARKRAIKARLKVYTLDDFKRLFEKAEASSFLKGRNDRNWSANFDWLIKDGNMAKVLDGNYDDRGQPSGGRQTTNKVAQQLDEFYGMVQDWVAEGGSDG